MARSRPTSSPRRAAWAEAGALTSLPDPGAAEWALLLASAPLLIAAAIWDLRWLRIPNLLNLALAAVFLGLAAALLPLGEVVGRLLIGLGALVLGTGFCFMGRMAGGDVKMLAACALQIRPDQAWPALQILALALLASLALTQAARAIPAVRRSGWAGLAPGAPFPMGVAIALATLTWRGLHIL